MLSEKAHFQFPTDIPQILSAKKSGDTKPSEFVSFACAATLDCHPFVGKALMSSAGAGFSSEGKGCDFLQPQGT